MVRSSLVVVAVVLTGAMVSSPAERTEAALGAEAALGVETVADTLRYEVRAGLPLIVGLPATHGGQPAQYRLRDAPALSWLVDRSFVWMTDARERGRLAITVEASADGVAPEPLVLLVDVTR